MPIFRGNSQLFRRFRQGEREALEQVYRVYVDKIASIVRHGFRLPGSTARVPGLGFGADEIADVVQEVFAKSFSAPARAAYDGVRDYGPYLYAIARNVIADRARRTKRELPTPWDELERARDQDLEPNDERPPWADEATIAAARDYVAGLADDLKGLHQARYVDGLSQREAAERLGISRQVLRTLEGRLRDGLRERLRLA
jgi:RNA polymerase sigma-70 factor (ECF subfamily)